MDAYRFMHADNVCSYTWFSAENRLFQTSSLLLLNPVIFALLPSQITLLLTLLYLILVLVIIDILDTGN